MELTSEIRTVLDAIAALDHDLAALATQRLEDHLRRDEPLLVVAGPQNAGKSTLIRRLLVDAGHPIPPWLRSGARPESTTGETVRWGGWRILDLPGIGSEQREHDTIAWGGAELVDALLLVMPPALLVGEGLEMVTLTDGSWYAADRRPLPWPEGALLLIIARVDSGSADPFDDPDELEDLKDEVSPGLDQLFGDLAVAFPRHWVAASPDARLDHVPEPTPETFDDTREWDGIDKLASALRELATGDMRVLRAAACERYVHRAAKMALESAVEDMERLRAQLDTIRAAEKYRAVVDSVVDAALASASAKLRTVLYECFAKMLEDPPARSKATQTLAREFAARAQEFEATYTAEMQAVVAELTQTLSGIPTISVPSAPAPHTTKDKRAGRTDGRLDTANVTKSLKTAAKHGTEFRIGGESVDKVRKRLEPLKKLEGEALTKKLKEAGFKDASEAERVRKAIKDFDRAAALLDAMPHAMQAFDLLASRTEARQDRQRAAKLSKDQDVVVSQLTEELMTSEPDGYGSRLEAIRAVVLEPMAGVTASGALLGASIENLENRVNSVKAAVAEIG